MGLPAPACPRRATRSMGPAARRGRRDRAALASAPLRAHTAASTRAARRSWSPSGCSRDCGERHSSTPTRAATCTWARFSSCCSRPSWRAACRSRADGRRCSSWPAAVLSNAGTLRDAGRFLRSQAEAARADLRCSRALPRQRQARLLGRVPGTPFMSVRAGPYFAAADDFGSPAYSPAEARRGAGARAGDADAELIHIHDMGLRAAPVAASIGTAPQPTGVESGMTSEQAGCVAFRPAAAPAEDPVPARAERPTRRPARESRPRRREGGCAALRRRVLGRAPEHPRPVKTRPCFASDRMRPRSHGTPPEPQDRVSVCALR